MATNNDSAFRALYSLLVAQLTRSGVNVGGTAGYPRVEINTITENERMDKAGDLRRLSVVIDCMTTDNLLAAHTLNLGNLTILDGIVGQVKDGYTVVGFSYTQLQDLSDTSDTQNRLYRLSQSIDFWMAKAPVTPTQNTAAMAPAEAVESAEAENGTTDQPNTENN